jgi:hypothetical protein
VVQFPAGTRHVSVSRKRPCVLCALPIIYQVGTANFSLGVKGLEREAGYRPAGANLQNEWSCGATPSFAYPHVVTFTAVIESADSGLR